MWETQLEIHMHRTSNLTSRAIAMARELGLDMPVLQNLTELSTTASLKR